MKESDARYIYAAFQGGGAKAVAYAGAVKAVYEQGYRFRGLSGTSAGAISATLLAADYSPDEIASKIPELLKCVRRTRGSSFTWAPDLREIGIFSLEKLRTELERMLRVKVRGTVDGEDVTFVELFEYSRIELNVLASRAPGVPVVFSVHSSPDCQVSYAVVASCSIPIVMSPQVIDLNSAAPENGASRVSIYGANHQGDDLVLSAQQSPPMVAVEPESGSDDPFAHYVKNLVVDGGAWANYPGVSFTDESLRHYFGAEAIGEVPVVGFTLDSTPLPERQVRSRRSIAFKWLALLPIRVLTSVPRLIYATGGSVLFAGAFLSAIGTLFASDLFLTGLGGWERALQFGFFTCLAAFAFLVMFMSTWAPAVSWTAPILIRALASTTVGLPEWMGAHPALRVLRVPAPQNLVGTITFDIGDEKISRIVDLAYRATLQQITEEPLDAPHRGRRSTLTRATRFMPLGEGQYVSDGTAFRVLLGAPAPDSRGGIASALEALGMK